MHERTQCACAWAHGRAMASHVRVLRAVRMDGAHELIGNCCADDTKVKNSKSFSHFAPHSSGEESTLHCRRNTCWCVPCSNGMPHLCEATELCGPVGEYTQLRTRAGRLNTRRGGTYRVPEGGAREDFWESLESKDHVIVRIHPDDRDDAEDDDGIGVCFGLLGGAGHDVPFSLGEVPVDVCHR